MSLFHAPACIAHHWLHIFIIRAHAPPQVLGNDFFPGKFVTQSMLSDMLHHLGIQGKFRSRNSYAFVDCYESFCSASARVELFTVNGDINSIPVFVFAIAAFARCWRFLTRFPSVHLHPPLGLLSRHCRLFQSQSRQDQGGEERSWG